MTVPLFDEPTTKAQVVFQQSLNVLFQCGHCSKLLLDQIPFAVLADGQLTDITCPRCKQAWAFLRVAQQPVCDPGLEHAEADAARHAKASRVRFR